MFLLLYENETDSLPFERSAIYPDDTKYLHQKIKAQKASGV